MANKKITNMEVKRKNRNRIYRYMCKNDIVSNSDIAYELKLSLPTVAQNTKELMELGLVKEMGELESTGGRKAKGLSIIANSKVALGIDITKNHIGVLLTNLAGEILKYERLYYPFSNSREYFSELNDKIKEFLESHVVDKESVLGIGISIPGIVDLDKKEITDSHALETKELRFSEIENYFEFPCMFLNDANAGAFAEGLQERDSFFYLSLSNTVGGSFFEEGKLRYGRAFRCGEIGHMTIIPEGEGCYCGKKGCMDSYCNAKNLSDLTEGKLDKFFDELERGRKEYAEVWNQYIKYLAIAINNIHMILDCDIVLGGYVGSYLNTYMEQIRQAVSERNTFSGDGGFIRECRYKIGAAAFGAALYVIEKFVEQI